MVSLMVSRSAFLVALLAILAGCTDPPDGVTPVTGFEAKRYMGTWYEIMRLDHSFEEGLDNVTATYALNPDGTVSVTNRGLDRETCGWDEAEATARFLESPDVASLAVTFFWPFSGGYHVIALDRAEYRYALVSGPSRDYLWILARTPDLDSATIDHLVDTARRLDFPVDDLIRVDHSPPRC